ncbi:ATP-binding protein [Polyangium spumosum]|uniref:AAA family ATPase n=1 Tax=Polyangium spumosum TaxID=889282 RepID=A0A6N7Q219_9BACT|nr:ATP-binding protein [Polyangium spumosum]MRG96655.1 AAA family ATPase [Polyangium spumosum]
MPEPASQLLPYDQIKQQLDAGAVACLAPAGPELVNAHLPAISYKKSTITVELAFQRLPREAFFPIVDVLAQYFRYFTELRRSYFGVTVVADHHSPFDRRLAEKRKPGEGPELPPPMKVTFRFDSKGHGAVFFEKEALLLQEEVNCILDVLRRYALHAEGAAGASSPQQKLAELGAVVFEASPAFSADRIAGYERTKRDVEQTIVLPLLHPEIFMAVGEMARTRPGASVPRAVLFEGPPGTGKTTMARVIASQSGIPLVYVPVESIMSKWFGESEKRLDAIFDRAGALPRSIVFLDEIDAFAGSRDRAMHEGTRRILSVLLRQMQGLVDTSNVVVIGATNRKDDLDPALLSRFNLFVHFPLPDAGERAAILAYYAKHLAPEELGALSAKTEGRSGRELEDACGVAERMWASHIIATNASVTPPPVETYATAFRLKFRLSGGEGST